MGETSLAARLRATSEADRADSGRKTAVQLVSEYAGWFAELARPLLAGGDRGHLLHVLTDVHERSCHRYASGERGPTGWLVRQLLWSPQGRTWLNAIMEGC